MKKQILTLLIATLTLLIASLCLGFSSYQIQEETLVINVEIPVRVFKGNTFVDNLTIEDFEVYEDGKLQKIEAVYLIRKKSIERREEKRRFVPQISRHFYLWFEISEYMPRIRKAVDYFFDNVFFPGDNLVIITPLKAYNLKGQALALRSGEKIANQLITLLRRDATIGNSEYRAVLRDLREIAKVIEAKGGGQGKETSQEIEDSFSNTFEASSLEEVVEMYSSIVERLESLRRIDQQKLLNFAGFLKNKEGQKHIFLFYEREFLPQLHPNTLSKFMSEYQDRPSLLFSLSDLFKSYKREVVIDVEKVKQAFADSSISIHFLFITKPPVLGSYLLMQERSEDVYLAFKQMAQATGGLTETSANPAYAFKRAIEAFENYYLLYYSPENYKRDGEFKKIKVRVKNKKLKITHRAGYFAN
jgi:hypothetical protein